MALLLAGWSIYAGVMIWQRSVVIQGQRCFVLFDDTMISMRYAHNLAAGHGLVWNPGERPVEGFSNPLWTIYMAGIHLLPIPPAKTSLVIQITGAACLLLNLIVLKRIADSITGDPAVSFCAALMAACYLPLNMWGLVGTEVSLLALLYGYVTLRLVRALQARRFDPWIHILLGITTLVRLDAAVFLLVAEVFLLSCDSRNRRRNLLSALAVAVLFIGGQALARRCYYGDWLPNTYYLKLTGFPVLARLAAGGAAAWQFIAGMSYGPFFVPLLLLVWRRERAVLLLWTAVLAQMAYSIYAGGDAWEAEGGSNRYISPAMPFFFLLLATTVAELIHRLPAKSPSTITDRRRLLERTVLAVVTLISIATLDTARPCWQGDFAEGAIRTAKIIEQNTTPDARVAVVTAGMLSYFCDRPMIDLLGKSDWHVARRPMHILGGPPAERWPLFLPGHLKWDSAYSIGRLRPDIIVELWDGNGPTAPEDARPYLSAYRWESFDGRKLQVLRDSPRVLTSLTTRPGS